MPTTVDFTEEMKGLVALGESDYERGEQNGQPLLVHLAIQTEDIDLFLIDPDHKASIRGFVRYDALGGMFQVQKGVFWCLVEDASNSRKMFYRLFFCDGNGTPYTLSGVKNVRHDGIQNIWRDTSTLFVKLFRNHINAAQEDQEKPAAAGVIHIGPLDFLQQITTFRAEGGTFTDEVEALGKFGRFFFGGLWDVYKPKRGSVHSYADERHIPLFTLSGVKNADISTHYCSTPDYLGLSMFRFQRKECQDVVVLLHGLTTSTDMFVMPEHYNIVNYLLDNGYTDVWSVDWRGSMRYSYDLFPAKFTMDDIALYDMPAAFAKIRQVVGPEARIHVIAHCVGSLTFMMSLYAGLIDGVTSVISNSVSLTPRIPSWCHIKLAVAPVIFRQKTDFNPRWAYSPSHFSFDKLLTKWISLWHPECQVPACHIVSFMWGSGHPAVWMHENLDEVTHARTGDLFGPVNINYYHHVRMMASKGVAEKMYPNDPRYDRLPNNYLQHAATIDTPILFVTGAKNNVFVDSNVVTYQTLTKLNPNQSIKLKVFDGYGHQDPFMGKHSDVDIFPEFIRFLDQYSYRKLAS
jgi:cholesterol oxidase